MRKWRSPCKQYGAHTFTIHRYSFSEWKKMTTDNLIDILGCVYTYPDRSGYPDVSPPDRPSVYTKTIEVYAIQSNTLRKNFCTCIHLNRPETGTSTKATKLIERWMVRCEGTWSNDHDWLYLRSLRSPNLGIAFSSRKRSIVERSNWEPSSSASFFGFLDLCKKEEVLNPKVNFWRAVVSLRITSWHI